MNEKKYERAAYLAHLLICIGGGAVLFYVFVRFGLNIVLPFGIGWAVALMISPVAKRLAGKRGRGERLWSAVLLIALLSLLIFLIIIASNRLFREARQLLLRLSAGEFSEIPEKIGNFIKDLTDVFPSLGSEEGFFGFSDEIVTNLVSSAVSSLTNVLTGFLSSAVRSIPSFLLFVMVTVISSFYFCLDVSVFHGFLRKLLPPKLSEALPQMKRNVLCVAGKYFRAYVLILLMTFCQLFIGFGIMRLSYSFLLALVISFVDILPVLGVGSVLLPWAAFSFLSGQWNVGAGLLVIYGCVTVVRQIAEPKIVGGSIGLHPLATLVAMYAGLKLVGMAGLIFGPVAAIIVKSCLDVRSKNKKQEKIQNLQKSNRNI